MARELADVLHYFIPASPGQEPVRTAAPPITPVVAVPIGPRELVRAAFAWNLAVEMARLGATVSVMVPTESAGSLWPATEIGPLGAELVVSGSADAEGFADDALALARARAEQRGKRSLVLACPTPAWLEATPELLARALLFTTPEPRALEQTLALARRLLAAAPDAGIGVTVHGVDAIEPARRAFLELATAAEHDPGRPLLSYGLLVDDLHVYRAIAELRPLALTQPQSRAARALRDVARLLLEDIRAADA